jgi:Arm DNA-binding domain
LAATDFLTEARIRNAKPKGQPYKLRDGGRLYLLITPANARLWRFRYKVSGRESMLGLGTYPATSLKAARARRAAMHAALEAGKNPAAERRAERASSSNTFEAIAREWLTKQSFAPKTLKKAVWTFEDLLFPYIGSRPVVALTPPEGRSAIPAAGGASQNDAGVGGLSRRIAHGCERGGVSSGSLSGVGDTLDRRCHPLAC